MKSYLEIRLPIRFVYLRKNGGWYYTKDERGRNKGPLIKISANEEMFSKCRLLFHEFFHCVADYLPEISEANLKSTKISSDSKVANLIEDSLELEEKLAEEVGRFAKKKFKELLLTYNKKRR